MRPVDVISDALHRQTLCDDAPGCAVVHDTEAEQIAAALRRAGWRFVDADTLEVIEKRLAVAQSDQAIFKVCRSVDGPRMRTNRSACAAEREHDLATVNLIVRKELGL